MNNEPMTNIVARLLEERLVGHVPVFIRNNSMMVDAYHFARIAHTGQRRKYTNEPYILHPMAVAQKVYGYTGSPVATACAYLHDTVEDTDVVIEDIADHFDDTIAGIVDGLTDKIPMSAGNRKVRKALEAERLGRESGLCQLIKVFDIMDNMESICRHDKKFAKVFIEEKSQLLDKLTKVRNEPIYEVCKRLNMTA